MHEPILNVRMLVCRLKVVWSLQTTGSSQLAVSLVVKRKALFKRLLRERLARSTMDTLE